MRVILHIGLHKTGTSTLQVFLKHNAEALANRGVLYRVPPGPHQTNHHAVMLSFSIEERRPIDGHAFLRGLIDEARSGYETLLISSEMLCEERVDADAFLAALPRPITAIAYVRRPDEFLVSAYNYQVRDWYGRRTTPIAAGIAGYRDLTFVDALYRWMRDDVRLVLAPYDQRQWCNGDLCCDFLSMIALKDVGDFEFISERHNEAWPESVIEMLRVFNQVPISQAQHAALVANLEGLWRSRSEAFPRFPLLSDAQRTTMRRAMTEALPRFRPYYREGFDDRYLTEAPSE